jgi:ArsR family transcriptional regulator, arsenate/arsenite/antimonite-responsive transcriptional repressor
MNPMSLFKTLADPMRLRMLNLLEPGPLCVCHLMDILDAGQVRVSKQLRYMKDLGVVEGERHAQWKVYRLSEDARGLVQLNLRLLREQVGEWSAQWDEDLEKRRGVLVRLQCSDAPLTQVIGCSEDGEAAKFDQADKEVS